VLSDAGSTPAASKSLASLGLSSAPVDRQAAPRFELANMLDSRRLHQFPSMNMGLRALRSRRLHYFSTAAIQQPDRAVERGRTQVHVPLRRRQVLMPRQLLNGAGR